jgi:hypothetical protein
MKVPDPAHSTSKVWLATICFWMQLFLVFFSRSFKSLTENQALVSVIVIAWVTVQRVRQKNLCTFLAICLEPYALVLTYGLGLPWIFIGGEYWMFSRKERMFSPLTVKPHSILNCLLQLVSKTSVVGIFACLLALFFRACLIFSTK